MTRDRTRLALAIALVVGCGTPAARPPEIKPIQAARVDPAPDQTPIPSPPIDPPPQVVPNARPRGPIVAPHGGAIEIVAITPDGNSALTSDQLEGMRLWPTLDGSREPLVVDLPAARQLAIGKRQAGYVVAALDDVGGIVVATLDTDGRTIAHATLPADPGFGEIEMTESGLLAWRKDQTIALIGDDGATKSQLSTEAGQHVLGLGVTGKLVAASIDVSTPGNEVHRARWLTLGSKLAWGAWIDAGAHVPSQIAVSPSGRRLASLEVVKDGARKLVVVDVANKGAELYSQAVGDETDVEMLDETHVIASGPSTTMVFDVAAKGTGTALPTPSTGTRPQHSVLAVAGGRALVGFDGELQIVTPTATKYLGYDLASPPIAEVAAKGELLVGLGTTFYLLDSSLEVASTPKLSLAPNGAVSEIRWLGGDDWVAETSNPDDGKTSLVVLDLAKGSRTIIKAGMTIVHLLMHEASNHVVTLSLGDAPEVLRFDPITHKLDRLSGLAKPKTYEQTELVPVSPKLAGGTQLLRVTMRDRVTIQWLSDPRALDKATSTVTVEGSLAATDAAGHAYVWRNVPAGHLELAIYAAGKPIATLPTDGPIGLWPDPTGARVIEVGARTVALYTVDGHRVWARPIGGVTTALWLGDGAIAVVSAAGIARLDPKTGAVVAARCGWHFGLAATPHPPGPRIEPVCAQLDH